MKPITRKETYLAKAAGDDVSIPSPITREEVYLNALATGEAEGLPDPVTREEVFLKAAAEGGGGGGASVVPLSVMENGTYTAEEGTAYSPVTVNVAAVSKLPQVVDRTIKTGITAADLGGITKIGPNAFTNCTYLKSVEIPAGVTKIENSAFSSCLNLTSITIPSSVTFIGSQAFSSCEHLTSIELPSGVTTIREYAFQMCSRLTSIVIPSGVTAIATRLFYMCAALSSVTIEATTPPTLGSNVFDGTHADLVIYVPAASVSAYQSASGWSDYASKIQAIPNS